MTAGIEGHRFFYDQEVEEFVSFQCTEILSTLQQNSQITALSAIAKGSDTIFADAALSLNIPLEIVRPFDTYVNDFVSEESRASYKRLREAAYRETILTYPDRSEDAYYEAMRYIVLHSDLLIAVWDCLPAKGRGGTGEAVKLAIALRKDWIHLNVVDRTAKRFNFGEAYQNLAV
jgi:hypothetical protein